MTLSEHGLRRAAAFFGEPPDLTPLEYRSPGAFSLTWDRRGVRSARIDIRGGQGGSGVVPAYGGVANYWAELVRSSSRTSLIEDSAGIYIWLRTSDGEPLEQQGSVNPNSRWQEVEDDTEEPDFVNFVNTSLHWRFRKPGSAWLPSDSGTPRLNSIPWQGGSVYRFAGNPVQGASGQSSIVTHDGSTYTAAGTAGTATTSDGALPSVVTQTITGLSPGDIINITVGDGGDASADDGYVVITPLR